MCEDHQQELLKSHLESYCLRFLYNLIDQSPVHGESSLVLVWYFPPGRILIDSLTERKKVNLIYLAGMAENEEREVWDVIEDEMW